MKPDLWQNQYVDLNSLTKESLGEVIAAVKKKVEPKVFQPKVQIFPASQLCKDCSPLGQLKHGVCHCCFQDMTENLLAT